MGETSPSRNRALDGIRALAFLAVLGCHLGLPAMPNGGIGVNVFFVLSGYLITSILLAERRSTGRIALGRFYARRAIRLMPALVALVVVWTGYALVVPGHRSTLRAVPSVLLYVGNWQRAFHGPDAIGFYGHTWSLSIEEQFYILWPLILLIAAAWRGPRAVLACAIAGSIGSVILRIALWHGPASVDRVYNGTDTVADQLLIGCALAVCALLFRDQTQKICRLGFIPGAAILVALIPVASLPGLRFTIGYTVVAIAAAMVVGHAALEPVSTTARLLSWPPLAFTGLISYGLYLWHYPIILAAEGHLHSKLVLTFVATVATFIAAYASWRLIEQPALSLKSRFAVTAPSAVRGRHSHAYLRPEPVSEEADAQRFDDQSTTANPMVEMPFQA